MDLIYSYKFNREYKPQVIKMFKALRVKFKPTDIHWLGEPECENMTHESGSVRETFKDEQTALAFLNELKNGLLVFHGNAVRNKS